MGLGILSNVLKVMILKQKTTQYNHNLNHNHNLPNLKNRMIKIKIKFMEAKLR